MVATRNRGKLREIAAILAGLPLTVRGLDEFPEAPPVPETGSTFEENARLKALAAARAERVDHIERKLVDEGKAELGDFEFHEGRNQSLARQAETLRRLLDTGRRTAEAVAILKKRVPPQLRIDSIEVATQQPAFRPTRGAEKDQESRDPTTRLLLTGTVAERDKGKAVGLADAQDFVGKFLKSLEQETALFANVEVNRYPSPDEPPSARTFKMTVTYKAPFYGGQAMELVKR